MVAVHVGCVVPDANTPQIHDAVFRTGEVVAVVHADILHTPLVVLHVNPVDAVHKFVAVPIHKHVAVLEPLAHGIEQTPVEPQ